MKKILFSFIFIGLGSLMWKAVSNTARYSFKKWDAAIQSAVKDSLRGLGVVDADIMKSINHIKQDADGQWVCQSLVVRLPKGKTADELKNSMEKSGIYAELSMEGERKLLMVKRGKRVFQNILVEPS